jgi:hypothetical protein
MRLNSELNPDPHKQTATVVSNRGGSASLVTKRFITNDRVTMLYQIHRLYVGVLISLWLFLFAAQPKEFFLDGLKKLEQRSHKCVELRGEYVE